MPSTTRSLVPVWLLAAALSASSLSAQGLVGLINPGGDRQLAAVNASNGVVTPLASPIAGKSLSTSSGVDALDRTGNRFFFVGTPSGDSTALFAIDTITGAKISSPAVSNAQNGILGLDWDGGESKLYCLVSVGPGDRQLCSVNTATGAVTLIGSPIAGASLSTAGAHSLDATGNRFFFVGTPSGGNPKIYAINTATGGVSSSPDLSGSASSVQALAWDPINTTLYALFGVAGGDRQFGTINTSTGVETLFGNPIAGASLSSSAYALDEGGDRYFFTGTPSAGSASIYTLSTINGIESSSPALSGPTTSFLALGFDPGPLFADGFESGNLTAWSASVP